MRRVILAAAFAATFCLSQTSLAQTGDGGVAGADAPAGGVPVTNSTQGPGASGQGAQGGPPTMGSYSVQNQPQGTSGNQVGGTGTGQTLMGPGDQGSGASGTAMGTGSTETDSDRGMSSPRAGEETVEGPASEDAQVELAKLRAEVERLREELDRAKGVRSSRKGEEAGTGGSGAQPEQETQPVASAVFEGRVKKVSQRSIEVIDYETGEPYVLRVNEDTRARLGNQRIRVTQIREGSEVRASFDLISGDTFATQIEVIGKRRR